MGQWAGRGLSDSLGPLPTASWFTVVWTRVLSAWRPAGAQACSPCSACGTAPYTCLPACRMGPWLPTLGPVVRMEVLGAVGGQPWALTGSQILYLSSGGGQAKEAAQNESGHITAGGIGDP